MEALADWLTRREHVVVASLADGEHAARAIRQLLAEGIPHSHVSLLAMDQDAAQTLIARCRELEPVVLATPVTLSQDAEGTGTEEVRHALYGAGIGAALTLVALAMPGMGPALLASGPVPIATTALGLATAGGGFAMLIGSILDDRGSEEHRAAYQEDLERGLWVVAVHGPPDMCEAASALLRGLEPSRLERL
jgi:hypothetical protein